MRWNNDHQPTPNASDVHHSEDSMSTSVHTIPDIGGKQRLLPCPVY